MSNPHAYKNKRKRSALALRIYGGINLIGWNLDMEDKAILLFEGVMFYRIIGITEMSVAICLDSLFYVWQYSAQTVNFSSLVYVQVLPSVIIDRNKMITKEPQML